MERGNSADVAVDCSGRENRVMPKTSEGELCKSTMGIEILYKSGVVLAALLDDGGITGRAPIQVSLTSRAQAGIGSRFI